MEIMNNFCQSLSFMADTVDNLSISFLLGILGIAITIFTVIYSFMESTKQRKRELGDRIALLEQLDPVLESDLTFAIEYLKQLRRMNMAIVAILLADIVVLAVYAAHMLLSNVALLWYIALGLELLLIIICLATLFIYLYQYHQRFHKLSSE